MRRKSGDCIYTRSYEGYLKSYDACLLCMIDACHVHLCYIMFIKFTRSMTILHPVLKIILTSITRQSSLHPYFHIYKTFSAPENIQSSMMI